MLEMLQGSMESFQGAQRLWPASHWEFWAEGRNISTLESPRDMQDSLRSPQCHNLGLNAANSEQSHSHHGMFYPGSKYPKRTGAFLPPLIPHLRAIRGVEGWEFPGQCWVLTPDLSLDFAGVPSPALLLYPVFYCTHQGLPLHCSIHFCF